ncbi:MAG: DNA polymerase III subunit alpha, partial [Sphingomonas sp.]
MIRYVREKYGADSVAMIITFGTLQAKAVVRDVGRVMQMPYGQVDRLAKLIPFNPAKPPTLDEAIAAEPKFDEEIAADARVGELIDTARALEGMYRNAGTHAAGVVIADRPLVELVPLYND